MTADDLPFGLSDYKQWLKKKPVEGILVGSQAHPDSVVPRRMIRNVMSAIFRVLRKGLLGMTVRDSQGTIIAPATWLKSIAPKLLENGYLTSTEILLYAENHKLLITELPVRLRSKPSEQKTRIRLSDINDMTLGLLRLRRRVTN